MSTNIVPLQTWYYRMIVRIIMHGKIYYHTAIVECTKERISFWQAEICLICQITDDNDWSLSNIYSWDDAVKDLSRKASPFQGRLDPKLFFITLRPLHGEFEVLVHSPKHRTVVHA